MPDELLTPPVETLPEPPVEEHEEKEPEFDPGTLEGLPKPDSPNVQKRIDKLTAKYRAEERARQELEKKVADMDAQHQRDMEIARQHNDQLIAAMNKASSRQAEPAPEDEIAALSQEVKKLKAQRADAVDKLDFKASLALEDQIEDLKDRITAKKIAAAESKAEKKITEKHQKTDVDFEVDRFARETEWFKRGNQKYDPLMAGAAVAYERELIQKPEWKNRDYADLLAEVKTHIEERFGYGKKAPKPPTVAGVGSPPGNGIPGNALTEEERRVARKMFPDMKPQDAERFWIDQKKGRV